MLGCVTLVPREDQDVVVEPPQSVENQTADSSEIRCVLVCRHSISNANLMPLLH
jgi:predicted transcriptional regulator